MVFPALAPFVAKVLFSGTITLPIEVVVIASGVAFAVCVSRGLGLALVALDRPNAIARANICAAIGGVSAAFVAIPLWGVSGGLLAALVAELIGVLLQMIVVCTNLGREFRH
jgi:hypothetical protein